MVTEKRVPDARIQGIGPEHLDAQRRLFAVERFIRSQGWEGWPQHHATSRDDAGLLAEFDPKSEAPSAESTEGNN